MKKSRYWGAYDMHRASVVKGSNPEFVRSVKDNLHEGCVPASEMKGFPGFLPTIKEGSDYGKLYIRADKMTTKETENGRDMVKSGSV